MFESFRRFLAQSGRVCILAALLASPATAATNIESARVRQLAAMLPAHAAGFGCPVADRAAWGKLAAQPAFAQLIQAAEKLAKQPVPLLPDDLYLDFSRTGNRDRCQRVMGERANRIDTLTLAECLENRGRFIQPLCEALAAVCSERTWVYPAHDRALNNFEGRTVEADLRATALGWELASVDYLLGDKLPSATRGLLRTNVERRVLQPFRDMVEGRRKEIFWMRATHNWNAVCLAGTVGAALALENSPTERAWYIAAAEQYIRYFLKSFTPDGYCSEGIGYWNYGFGHFIMLGEAIRQATGGRIDLLASPDALQPALFSTRAEILNGIFPTISDVHPGSRPDASWVFFLSQRLGLDQKNASAADFARPGGGLVHTLMFSFLPEPLPVAPHAPLPQDSALRTWFAEGGVLICRPAPESGLQFAAALKGGNNAENHNHNDVGSFSVVCGKTMLICDPGGEVYTARTFSSHRYDSKVLSSYGHAVPRVAGELQHAGASAKAVVLARRFGDAEDTLALDLRSAYAVPELQKLERTFTFRRRQPASLVVRDEVVCAAPKAFETALITWGKWTRVSQNELRLEENGDSIRVLIDTGGNDFDLHPETINEDVQTRAKPVRLGIALKAPVKEATVTLTITPGS